MVKHIRVADAGISQAQAQQMLQSWFQSWPAHARRPAPVPGVVLAYSGTADDAERQRLWRDDHAFLAWSEGAGASVIASQLKVGGLVFTGTAVGDSWQGEGCTCVTGIAHTLGRQPP